MSGSSIQYSGEKPSQAFKNAASSPSTAETKPPPPYSIRFTDEERARLNRDAGVLSLAAYIRLQLFSGDDGPPPRKKLTRKQHTPSAELAVVGHMLGGLGQSRLASNINQIAKAANMGALPVTPELEAELAEACKAIQDMRAQLIAAMGVKTR